MEMKITTLEGKEAGSVSLPDAIFGLEPRSDILQRCVNGKKMYAQKGTGGARHGSARVPQFRGGGRAFGPVVRSHAIGLPKKVRALALKHALSAKAKDGGIIVIDKMTLKDGKTKGLAKQFDKLGLINALIIDGAEVELNFRNAARNIPNIDVLPIQGINVYDIMRRKTLVLTKAALDALEARFK
jgi:large subunit ribosomal protein L4